MFIIVENESVILGPMPWRQTMFKNCLMDDLEIDFNVPYSNNTNDVIIVTENVKIMPVNDIGPNTAFDSKSQTLNGPFYNFYETYADMYFTVHDKDIELYKSELRAQVAANRWKYEIMGVKATIQSTEVMLLTNREDRNLYIQAYQMGTDNVNWKFGDIFLTITNQELGYIVLTGATHIQAVFDWEAAKNVSINEATTIAELNAIDVKSDNPLWEITA